METECEREREREEREREGERESETTTSKNKKGCSENNEQAKDLNPQLSSMSACGSKL